MEADPQQDEKRLSARDDTTRGGSGSKQLMQSGVSSGYVAGPVGTERSSLAVSEMSLSKERRATGQSSQNKASLGSNCSDELREDSDSQLCHLIWRERRLLVKLIESKSYQCGFNSNLDFEL